MIQKFRTHLPSSREKGFSIMEMLIVVLILGILATVAVFLYRGAQKSADEAAIKTGLLQASSLLEQEKDDLNGVYPKYIPNEISQNELWSKFSYSYSDDRLSYCLKAWQPNENDPNNLDAATMWSVSSSTKDVQKNVDCAFPNYPPGTTPPYGTIVPPKTTLTSFAMSWPTGATSAKADLNWNSSTCSSGAAISYNIKLIDTSETITQEFKGVTGSNIAYTNLPGFLPSDTVTAQIQTVCTKTFYGQDVPTMGLYSDPPVSAVTPALPVPNTAWSVDPNNASNRLTPTAFLCNGTDPAATCANNTGTGFKMYSQGTFDPVTCPIGVNKFQVTAAQSGVASVSSAASTNRNQSWALTNFAADTKIDYEGYAYCVITRSAGDPITTVSYPSAKITFSEYAPVGWPSAVPTIGTTSAYSGTGTTPNGLTWTAATCSFGGTPQYQYVQTAPGTSSSTFQTTLGAGPISWQQATTYTYRVDAKCVGANSNANGPVASRVTQSNPYQFTTDVDVPTPTFATTPAAYHPTGTTMKVKGAFNAITCANNSIPYYSVTLWQPSTGAYFQSGNSTSTAFDFDVTGAAADTYTEYYSFAYCYVKQADNSYTPYTSALVRPTEYTPISAPGAAGISTGVTGNPEVVPNVLIATNASCPYGGSIQYRFAMTNPSSGTSTWGTGTTFTGIFAGNNVDMGNLNNGTNYTVAAQTYCAGTNVNSPTTTGNAQTFTGAYNTPGTPNRPGSINVSTGDPTQTQTVSWSSVSCNRGGTPQYYMAQSTHNGNNNYGTGSGYNTGWTTNTSWNTSSWIDYQGAYYEYTVQARCANSTGTSGASSWTYSGTFTEGIQKPSAPGGMYNNAYSYVSWNGVSCPSGTYVNYYVVQDEKDWNYYWTELANRTGNTYVNNVGGGVSGQQRVFVQAYCNSATISGYTNSSDYSYTQWRTYGSPSISQNSIGGCSWSDVFTYNACNTSYNSGYPGITYSTYNGNLGGLNYNTSGQVYGTPNNPGTYALYGTLYNDAGNSGNTWLGNVYVPEYNMNAHNASDNWYTAANSAFQPCTNYAYNNPGPNCSATAWNHGRSNTIKFVVNAGNGVSGQMNFNMKGLVNGNRYRVSCDIGSAATTASFSSYGLYVGNGPGAVTVSNPNAQTWYNLTYDWTYTGNQSTVGLYGVNKNTSVREFDVSNCSINQI